MTKKELITEVATKTGKSKAETERTIEIVLGSIKEHLVAGEKVTLTGFGTFDVRDRAPRSSRNPHTGDIISVPASKGVGFKASSHLKEAVKNA